MIIALTGPKCSGKTTLAKLLEEKHGFKIMPFAAPIKIMIWALFKYQGASDEEARELIWGNRKEERTKFLSGCSTRWAMQSLGTEWGRDLMHADLWINVWKNAVEETKAQHIVVDDLRFLTEEIVVRAFGGNIVRITRKELNIGVDEHKSEQEWRHITPDIHIFNDAEPIVMLEQLIMYIDRVAQ